MDNSLMLALQAQRVLQHRMDVAANNLANVNTTGFKADALVLEFDDGTTAHADETPADIRFVRDVGLMRDLRQGEIAMTGNPFDVAIEGQGFFAVQGPNGRTLYTRDGSFAMNASGQLVTSDGHPVLSAGGSPIVFDAQGESPSIGRDGAVSIAGAEVARINVTNFANPSALDKVGENLWDANGAATAPFEGVLAQGALESSNVRPVIELTRLIEISRAYQSAAKIVSDADALRRQAIQELGAAA